MNTFWKKLASGLLIAFLLLTAVMPAAVFAETDEAEPADGVTQETAAEPEEAEPVREPVRGTGDEWAVTLTSRTADSATTVGRVSGGGTYSDGDSVTVIAYPSKGYTFVAWYDVNDTSFAAPLCEAQTYTFTVTADTSLVALYAASAGAQFSLTVHASLFTVNNGSVQSDMITYTYNAGEMMYISFCDDRMDFLYWVNSSGNILSTKKDFSFALASDTEITAYYANASTGDTSAMVVFRNAYNQVLSSRSYAYGEAITYPDRPVKMGHTFKGWYLAGADGKPTATEATEANIWAAMAGANTVIIVPDYVASGEEYTVTVEYTNGTEQIKDSISAVLAVGDSKTFTAPEISGYTFQYWMFKGTKASYSSSYTVLCGVKGEAVLEAVYGTEAVTPESTIMITQTYVGKNAGKYVISNTLQYYAPQNVTVMEVGFVFGTDSSRFGVEGGADALVLGGTGTKQHKSNFTGNDGIYTFNATTADPYKTMYTKAYMICKVNREEVTLYSDMTVGSYDSLVEKSRFTHSAGFANVDTYLYRIGNSNAVKLGSIFAARDPETEIDSGSVTVTVAPNAGSNVSANPTYTKNTSDWTQSTLKFTGTGPITLTINDGGIAYTVGLEIVAGKNVTAYSELNGSTNCVLLNDIEMSSNGKFAFSGVTLYGNGFTFDVTAGRHDNTTNGSESGNYVISLSNAKLDNVQIMGAVYPNYGIATKAEWNYPCVLVNGGSCEILNCCISNCASPVRARGGANLLIKNTTLRGGTFCNLDIRSGVHVTVDGLTTINQIGCNDTVLVDGVETEMLGLGIIFYYEGLTGDESLRIIGDGLTQYNTVAKTQKDNTISTAQSAYDMMFGIDGKFIYDDGTTQWVCTGILSLTSTVDKNDIDTPAGYDWQAVSMMGRSGYVFTKLAAPAQPAPDYAATAQGAIAPAYSFEYPTASGKKNYQEKIAGSTEYCYWDSTQKAVLIGFAEGGSKTFDPNILTVSKNGKTITPTVKLDDGAFAAVTNSITISTEGKHTLTYRYEDPYNYRLDGNGDAEAYTMTYTKTVELTVTVANTDIDPATFDFNGNGYRSVTANNVTYIMPDVNATETDVIGSKVIGGQTVYYPILWSKNSSATGNATKAPVLCPIFDEVITITDHDADNNVVIYDSSTTTMADGKLVAISDVTTGSSFLSWNNGGLPPADNPCIVKNKLYYKSITISGVDRAQTTYVCEYQFTDTAGNAYRYFVGYIFPQLKSGCVATGTMITLADGTQKPIEQITASDKLLAWDFLEGRVVERYVSGFAYHGDADYAVTTLAFSNGAALRMIEEHGMFDYDLNRYVYVTEENYAEYIGHRFPIVGTDGVTELAVLEDVRFTVEHTGSYAIASDGTFNAITEGLVSVVPPVKMFNCFEMDPTCKMKYDRAQLEADIETYGLYTCEDFAAYITEAQFEMYGYAYFRIAVGKGVLTFEDVLAMIELHKPYMFDRIWSEGE